ncbi:uncharacterized protein YeaO (DUF488 family) [Actinocorallia herbida]|uniref:Uncharacterized protein YeaO (DUF488 family) n=1 Tax=Actinocorallia herbida TaxID=58109 RepID=A0A3N1D0F5_9ACTN|nr:DUF488 family protein [Actinocorallia herbida]ROO86986.1 uncharacterized protein YeaO (DUF488 family) [Actinocorallia herbida]
MVEIGMRRVYEDLSGVRGTRVLVDRLWPRGVAKAEAPWDEWLKDVAPSNELRRWYGHAPEREEEFGRRYLAELDCPARGGAVARLRELTRSGPVVLLTSTKEIEHSHLPVLAGFLSRNP